ncbi:MAG: hypothetical protein IPI30_12305 [Saprospiraceae bacterium]|nr:hypothetical protein [Candidatus Vicinibacter affinis]
MGSILALLLISDANDPETVREMMPTEKEDLSMREITLAEPPQLTYNKPSSSSSSKKWILRLLKRPNQIHSSKSYER